MRPTNRAQEKTNMKYLRKLAEGENPGRKQRKQSPVKTVDEAATANPENLLQCLTLLEKTKAQ